MKTALIAALLLIPTMFASAANAGSARACFVRMYTDVRGLDQWASHFSPGSDEKLSWSKEVDYATMTLKDKTANTDIEGLKVTVRDSGSGLVDVAITQNGRFLQTEQVSSESGWSGQIDSFVRRDGKLDVLQIYCVM